MLAATRYNIIWNLLNLTTSFVTSITNELMETLGLF
jgi:hypothetical protein